MTAINLEPLSAYEEQWVALTKDLKVVAHALKLADLRKNLGQTSDSYSYFFVPSAKIGYSGFCRI